MEYSRHLLDNLYPDNHLLLLEAMIPYIDPAMQLPLALYIKFQEVQFILSAFRNPDRLYSCGFYPGNISNEDLLQTLSRSMGFHLNMFRNSFTTSSQEQASDHPFGSTEHASDSPLGSTEQSSEYPFGSPELTSNQPVNSTEQSWMAREQVDPEQAHQESPEQHQTADDFTASRDDMIDAIREILKERQDLP